MTCWPCRTRHLRSLRLQIWHVAGLYLLSTGHRTVTLSTRQVSSVKLADQQLLSKLAADDPVGPICLSEPSQVCHHLNSAASLIRVGQVTNPSGKGLVWLAQTHNLAA